MSNEQQKGTRWTIGQQLALGFTLPILILIALGAVAYESTQRLMQTSYWVSHTHEVLTSASSLFSALQDIQMGQRGYVITGKEEFLDPYKNGTENAGKEFARMRELTTDNPKQQRRLDTLQPLIADRAAFAKKTIETRKSEGLEAASQMISSGQGKKLMDEIRRVTDEIADEENELLTKRAQESDDASTQVKRVLVGGTLLALVLVIGVAMYIIRGINRHIGTVVQKMRSASAELEAASTQQVKGAKEQASSTAEVSTTVRELVSTARQISENAQRVTQVATEMSGSTRAGDQTVTNAKEAIEMVRQQVDQIVGHMLELGKKSQDIGSILEIINELAEQTNILAINATIEAVGAGETGRRFGVVAGEIRKLADRVSTSTKDIRRLIEEIRSSANTTVMATEDGAKAVDAGTRRFTDVTESFRRIAEHVVGTTQAAREIELSTKQQTSAMEQVSSAIVEVSQAARETEASSAQVQQTAAELASLSGELLRLIEREAA